MSSVLDLVHKALEGQYFQDLRHEGTIVVYCGIHDKSRPPEEAIQLIKF